MIGLPYGEKTMTIHWAVGMFGFPWNQCPKNWSNVFFVHGNHCIMFHTKLFKLIQNIARTNKKSHLATLTKGFWAGIATIGCSQNVTCLFVQHLLHFSCSVWLPNTFNFGVGFLRKNVTVDKLYCIKQSHNDVQLCDFFVTNIRHVQDTAKTKSWSHMTEIYNHTVTEQYWLQFSIQQI